MVLRYPWALLVLHERLGSSEIVSVLKRCCNGDVQADFVICTDKCTDFGTHRTHAEFDTVSLTCASLMNR